MNVDKMRRAPARRGLSARVVAEALRITAHYARKVADVLDSGADLADKVDTALESPAVALTERPAP